MPFSAEQRKALQAPLDDERIHTRRKQGIELRYVEGYSCIDQANAIFGYHGWGYTVTKLDLQSGVWVATVLLEVRTPDGEIIQREDVGVGIPAAARGTEASPDAQETAIKAAVTDAMKRALRTWGNAFGNSLYSKDAPHEDAPVNGERQETGQRQGEDVMEVQRGVLSRLKTILQKTKYDPAAYEDLRAAWLNTAGVEHWGKLSAAQWRTYERDMTNRLGGEIPTAVPEPGTWDSLAPDDGATAEPKCPTCGAWMAYKEGTNKAGKAYAGYFCSDRNCPQTPLWSQSGSR